MTILLLIIGIILVIVGIYGSAKWGDEGLGWAIFLMAIGILLLGYDFYLAFPNAFPNAF